MSVVLSRNCQGERLISKLKLEALVLEEIRHEFVGRV
jgi:hypothetical protein